MVKLAKRSHLKCPKPYKRHQYLNIRLYEFVIGVLAIQGDFIEHINILQTLGVECREIRLPEQLSDVDGLIIPGAKAQL
ncbi:MAG: hypothetical protein CM1200mP15_23250 [Dehalococcoidia bacterium]|nr:MAG: hypothetical protein CM1200mP15_23250 [Dehalococcoidia bacterium]